MRMVFLDDNQERTLYFKSQHPYAETAETAAECIALLETGEAVDYLFLDHDLAGEVYVDSDREDCGMEVVRFMADYERGYDTIDVQNIVIHSRNEVAVERMIQDLEGVGYRAVSIPFPVLFPKYRGQ